MLITLLWQELEVNKIRRDRKQFWGSMLASSRNGRGDGGVSGGVIVLSQGSTSPVQVWSSLQVIDRAVCPAGNTWPCLQAYVAKPFTTRYTTKTRVFTTEVNSSHVTNKNEKMKIKKASKLVYNYSFKLDFTWDMEWGRVWWCIGWTTVIFARL